VTGANEKATGMEHGKPKASTLRMRKLRARRRRVDDLASFYRLRHKRRLARRAARLVPFDHTVTKADWDQIRPMEDFMLGDLLWP
jgi:hypothetical protein